MSLEFGVRLLLIEDEPDLAASMARGLRGQGYAVDWTPDGVEGLQMLDVDQYDLLVLDLGLPSMDGLEVLHRIRDSLPELMILVVTARSLPQQRARGLDLGADDYLVKPFHFEELCARLRALLRRDLRARSPVLQTGD